MKNAQNKYKINLVVYQWQQWVFPPNTEQCVPGKLRDKFLAGPWLEWIALSVTIAFINYRKYLVCLPWVDDLLALHLTLCLFESDHPSSKGKLCQGNSMPHRRIFHIINVRGVSEARPSTYPARADPHRTKLHNMYALPIINKIKRKLYDRAASSLAFYQDWITLVKDWRASISAR